jgi:two-component system LytT family response regulator
MRVLIVDDEQPSRDVLRLRLEDIPDIEVIGEAADGQAAVGMILDSRPDLVLLDVQMPDLDGISVLEAVSTQYLPMVIFVTAYDEHAIRAFELNALDYLLKPVAPKRLTAALERARAYALQREVASIHRRVATLLDHSELREARGTGPVPAAGSAQEPEPLRRIVVRDKDDYLIVSTDRVDAFEAAGNYVRITLPDRHHLVRGTLIEYERLIDPERFARIHRSTIINIDRIERVRPEIHGDFTVTLAGGKVYRMSRHYRRRVLP